MQPIDYMQGYKNPLQNILDQVKMYQEFNQNANILRSQKAQSQLEQATSERKIRAMQDLHNLDFDDESLLKKYVQEYKDLEYSKGIQDHLASLDEKQKQAEIGRISQTLSLLKNGKGDVAIDDLLAQAQAFENAGDSKNAEGARKMAQLIYQDPNSALDLVGKSYAVMVGKDGMSAYKDFVTTTAPNVQYQNMGGYGQVIKTDPITGEIQTKNVGNITQSADNVADNETKIAVAQMGYDSAENVANINGQYGIQKTNIEQTGQNARTQAELNLKSQLAEQEAIIKANEAKPMEAGGKMWLVKADGSHKPMLGDDGKQLLAGGGTAQKNIKEINDLKSLNDTALSGIENLEKALELNKQGIYSGFFADDRANFFDKLGSKNAGNTLLYQNLVMTNALSSLKTIFGGNPTEGERAILIDLQASVNKSPAVREQILLNAIKMAEDRIRSNNEQIQNYGGGAYITKVGNHSKNSQGNQQSASYNSMKLK